MASSTYYGWAEPDDTAYVKDGALSIRTLGNAASVTVNQIENFKGENPHPFLLMGA